MKTLKIGAAFASLLAMGAPIAASASTAHNIVLVPGAFTDKSSWDKVARLLRAKGFKVTEVDIPMTSLESDVAATRKVLDAQNGATVLVGHSWGGVVIGEVGDSPKVKSLVYVAAFAPDKGESVQALSANGPPTEGLKAVHPDAQGFLSVDPVAFPHVFVGDVSASEGAALAEKQKPMGVEQTWGRSGSETHLTGVQAPVHDSGSHLEDAVGALRRPPHLSSLVHARVDQAVDDGLRPGAGDTQPGPIPAAVVHQRRRIQGEICPKLASELDKALDTGLAVWGIQPDRVSSHIRDVTQRAASLIAVAVPDQVAQSRDIEVDVLKWALLLQVRAEEAGQSLLDMPHSHRDMEPIQDMFHPIARGETDAFDKRGITVTQYGDIATRQPSS
jgi:pimeloyl-ACP methyl ester carboxylesterase